MSEAPNFQLSGEAAKRLLDVARTLAAQTELRPCLASIIDAGREVLHADRGTVFLYDPGPRELFALVATGENEIRFSIDRGIAGECARTRKLINVKDCYKDDRFNKEVDRKTGYHTRCLITVPLIGLEDKLVGVMQLLNPLDKAKVFTEQDEGIATSLASQAAVAIQRSRLIDDRIEKLKLEADLDLARQIQQNILPKTLPDCPGYDLAHFNEPADQTGGDIYDVVALPNGQETSDHAQAVLLFLADATGHGIGPALSVTQARAMLRIGLRFSRNLDELLLCVNAQLTQDLAMNRFITAFMGILDPVKHEVAYHAPGQGPLLHFRAADGSCRFLSATTVPLGILDDPPLEPTDPIRMEPGDILGLLTDGFYEYQNGAEQLFGQERVEQVVAAHRDAGSAQIIEALLKAVREFAGGAPQLDDLTALVVKRLA